MKLLNQHFRFVAYALALVALLDGTSACAADSTKDKAAPLPVGFRLGEFIVKDSRPVDNEKFTLEFELYALVDPGETERFAVAFAGLEHRVRDKVLTSVRLSPVELFEEPDLAGFRRRILLRLRRAVPELAIEAVLVTDFRMLRD